MYQKKAFSILNMLLKNWTPKSAHFSHIDFKDDFSRLYIWIYYIGMKVLKKEDCLGARDTPETLLIQISLQISEF